VIANGGGPRIWQCPPLVGHQGSCRWSAQRMPAGTARSKSGPYLLIPQTDCLQHNKHLYCMFFLVSKLLGCWAALPCCSKH